LHIAGRRSEEWVQSPRKAELEEQREAGLVNAKPIPKNLANKLAPEVVTKAFYLRSKYYLGPIRIAIQFCCNIEASTTPKAGTFAFCAATALAATALTARS
jgi:hypothetical protein